MSEVFRRVPWSVLAQASLRARVHAIVVQPVVLRARLESISPREQCLERKHPTSDCRCFWSGVLRAKGTWIFLGSTSYDNLCLRIFTYLCSKPNDYGPFLSIMTRTRFKTPSPASLSAWWARIESRVSRRFYPVFARGGGGNHIPSTFGILPALFPIAHYSFVVLQRTP